MADSRWVRVGDAAYDLNQFTGVKLFEPRGGDRDWRIVGIRPKGGPATLGASFSEAEARELLERILANTR